MNLKLKSKWMLTGVSSILALTVLMPSAGADSLSELEKKQQEAQQKESQLDSGIKEKEEKITINQSTLEEILGKLKDLKNKIQETEDKISSVQNEIEQTKVEIEDLKKSIKKLEKQIAERTELLQDRARAIQLSGGSVDYIDVLLGASSFIDFIDRFSAVNTLMEADRKIMQEQADDKALLAEQKASVETKLTEQESRNAELVNLKGSLDGQKKEQDGLAKELEKEQKRLSIEKADLEDQHGEIIEIGAELEGQIAAEQERLAELARKAEEERQRKEAAERKAAEERAAVERAAAEKAAAIQAAEDRAAAKKAAAEKAAARNEAERQAAADREAAAKKASAKKAQSSSSSSSSSSSNSSSSKPAVSAPATNSSGFIKPASGRLTSNYGGRNIGSGNENHRGVDMSVPTGTRISASASGYVTHAGPMGTYGNVVMMTHSINGKNYSTVYAHLSSISVSRGQYVSQGQKIAASGNTGRSTGPHLHFEIHVGPWNGARSNAVNPLGYIN